MNEFQGKVIWMTGASSGYGEALARAFSAAGARLVLSARRKELLQSLARELGNAVVLPLDMEQPDEFALATQTAIHCFGHVDMQVHAAAVAQRASALETTAAAARRIMEIDYFGVTELARHVLPHFMARGQGHMVVISGLLAQLHLPGRSSYAAAKAALHGYFGCLRAELQGRNIHVTLLVPGAMQTEFASKALLADGSVTQAAAVKSVGCPVELAAEQSLQAIARREYESYIGLQDESFMLWRLTQCDPALGTELLLKKLQAT